jgi:hypothetical protein
MVKASKSNRSESKYEKKIAPVTQWMGGWVDPRASLGTMEKRKSFPCQDSNLSHPDCSQSLCRLSYPGCYKFVVYFTALYIDYTALNGRMIDR